MQKYQYQIDCGNGGGTTADGGISNKGTGTSIPDSTEYWGAKNRYIDIGENISVNSIKTISVNGETGAWDTSIKNESSYASSDGINWIYLGDFQGTFATTVSTLTVTNSDLLSAGFKSTDIIRYLRSSSNFCIDRTHYSIVADKTYDLSADITGKTGNYGGTWNDYTGPVTITSQGNHSITARALDNAGNISKYAFSNIDINNLISVEINNITYQNKKNISPIGNMNLLAKIQMTLNSRCNYNISAVSSDLTGNKSETVSSNAVYAAIEGINPSPIQLNKNSNTILASNLATGTNQMYTVDIYINDDWTYKPDLYSFPIKFIAEI